VVALVAILAAGRSELVRSLVLYEPPLDRRHYREGHLARLAEVSTWADHGAAADFLEHIPGQGHLAIVFDPATLTEICERFLAEVSG
jgi:hypothetical protein